ncbi:MAG: hypothetical protein WB797_18970 [Nocardioides sp.]
MIRRLAHVAATVAVLPLLAGCGGTSYCDAVKSHQAELGTITQGDGRTALLRALPVFEDLRAKAPADVADDWQLLVTRITALQKALDDAHVDPTTYDPRHPPAGMTAQQRQAIRRAAAGIAAADTQQALSDVQQEVLDVCRTPLEL